jgi:hypothetical protein
LDAEGERACLALVVVASTALADIAADRVENAAE